MSRVTELLNQITTWAQQYNSEEWHKVDLAPGLTSEKIQSLCKGKPFALPTEIFELYHWRNGGGSGSLLPYADGLYGEQEFYDLALGLGLGEEWERDYCPGTHLLALFGVEDVYYWTLLPQTRQELAPIYSSDEPDFATASSHYPSLEAMLDQQVAWIKTNWKID
ncbi:MAG: hypothetical protein F6K09_32925 [Merismopedia sp. SIO2A8]|nr:hypothetical protein [Symploca sp. SIO2B6]NET53294.1 hypothetical protein [Merismopedia sp. SIO2A8]